MATRLPAVRVRIEWIDGSGSTTESVCHRRSDESIAAVDSAAMGLISLLRNVSIAGITGYTATWPFHVSDTRPTTTPTTTGALLVFSTASAGEYVMFRIPSIMEGIIVDGEIDIKQLDIAGIADYIIAIEVSNPFGFAATTLLYVVTIS
jgi:hypothetical protein